MPLFRSAPLPVIVPPLRLGLVFFDAAAVRALRLLVASLASEQLPWQVVEAPPYHALLLARGPRGADAQHLAVLRLGSEAERVAVARYGDAMPPVALRRPLQPLQLRLALEMAAASLIPEHVAALSPQTRQMLPQALQRPATLL